MFVSLIIIFTLNYIILLWLKLCRILYIQIYKSIKLVLDDLSIAHLVDAGFDPQFGARPIKRVIQREIINELSKQILSNNINTEKEIKITCNKNHLIFEN